MNRTFLSVALICLVALGLVALLIPFGAALSPTPRAGEELPQLNISGMKPGSLAGHPLGDSHFILLRNLQGDYRLFQLRRRERYEGVIMPDSNWYGYGGVCLEMALERVLGEGLVISCKRALTGFDQLKNWRWSEDGKNLGDFTSDLLSPPFTLDGERIIVGRGG